MTGVVPTTSSMIKIILKLVTIKVHNMSKYLYKYAGPGNIERIFHSSEKFSFRCSYPKDFNDPYELFLTIDFSQNPRVLAFYEDVIGQMPQMPTTCFSKSPSVIPMWAHYANNHEGFAIEINEEKLSQEIPELSFGDIDYADKSSQGMQNILDMAFHAGKPRHIYLLQRSVLSAAYFTKNSCWSYEKERRMTINEKIIRRVNEIMLIDLPTSCINSIIIGARATPDTKEKIYEISRIIKCNIFELNIGRTTTTPFFRTRRGRTSVFNGESIERSLRYCTGCGEPVFSKITKCSWCRINESHKINAAYKNPFRALANAGILESYIKGMDNISNSQS